MPQYYPEDAFERLPASELLANRKHQYWLADGREEQIAAFQTRQIYHVNDDIYICYIARHGTVSPGSDTTIDYVDLDHQTCRVTSMVAPDTQLMVLKREYEPIE